MRLEYTCYSVKSWGDSAIWANSSPSSNLVSPCCAWVPCSRHTGWSLWLELSRVGFFLLSSFGRLLHDLPRGDGGFVFCIVFLVKNNAYSISTASAPNIYSLTYWIRQFPFANLPAFWPCAMAMLRGNTSLAKDYNSDDKTSPISQWK